MSNVKNKIQALIEANTAAGQKSETKVYVDPKEAVVKEMRKRKMPHPYRPGKEVSVVGFSETLAREGIAMDEYLNAYYIPRDQHEAQIAELQAELQTLQQKQAVTA